MGLYAYHGAGTSRSASHLAKVEVKSRVKSEFGGDGDGNGKMNAKSKSRLPSLFFGRSIFRSLPVSVTTASVFFFLVVLKIRYRYTAYYGWLHGYQFIFMVSCVTFTMSCMAHRLVCLIGHRTPDTWSHTSCTPPSRSFPLLPLVWSSPYPRSRVKVHSARRSRVHLHTEYYRPRRNT